MNVQNVFVSFTMFTIFCAMADWRTANAVKETTLRHDVPSSKTPKSSGSNGTVPPETTSKKEKTKTPMTMATKITTQKTFVATTIRPKPIGGSAPSGEFAKHVLRDTFFVDKTFFIHDLMLDYDKVISISRPRKWGKSLTLDMLNEFFNLNSDFSRFEKHGNLAIFNSNFNSFRESHMNKYAVIHIDFALAKGKTFDEAWGAVKRMIGQIFEKFQYLLKESLLTKWETKDFMEIMAGTADNPTYTHSIQLLSKLILQHHEVGPIILIDGADCMPAAASLGNFLPALESTLLNFFRCTLKTNVPPKKIIIFSVLSVFRMIVLSRVNNVDTYTILDNKFNSVFGFTRQEVEKLIAKSNWSSTLTIDGMSEWYKQTKVGDRDMYNPESVKSCLINGTLDTYTYHFGGSLENVTNRVLKESGLLPSLELKVLIKDGTLNKRIRRIFQLHEVYYDLDSMWAYFFHAGFITKAGPSMIKPAGLEVQKLLDKNYICPKLNSSTIDHDLMATRVRARDLAGVREILLPWIGKAGKYLKKHESAHVSIFVLNEYLEMTFRYYVQLYNIEVLTEVTNLQRDIAITFNLKNSTTKEWLVRKLRGPFEIVVQTKPITPEMEKGKDFADCLRIGSDCMNITKSGCNLFHSFRP